MRPREFLPGPSRGPWPPLRPRGVSLRLGAREGDGLLSKSVRNARLKAKYGITADRYDLILDSQGGICSICKRPPKTRRLAVDHDHKTKRVRGLLCHLCNQGLGFLRTAVLLRRAADYLEQPTWVTTKSYKLESAKTPKP